MQCPDCGETLDTATAVKRHVPPAHGWSLTDTRKNYLNNKLTNHDGQHVTLITWDEQNGGTEAIDGTLDHGNLSSELTDTNGETWTIQWLGGPTPSGYYLHEPTPEEDELGLPDPSRRVVEILA